MLGGILGVLTWNYFSSDLGFKGFICIAIICQLLWYFLYERKLARFSFALGIICLFTLREPEPLINKRDRKGLLDRGQYIGRFWDPNACAEFIKINPNLIMVLFDGGSLRTHIDKFDGDFVNLKKRYLNHESAHVWGLDVVVPHFAKEGINTKVALISALGGQEILAAKAFGASAIYAIDINTTAQKKIILDYSNFSKNTYENVTSINLDGRYFIENTNEKFDVIQIYSAANASYSSVLGAELRPSSLITVEAFKSYMNALKDDGILSITQYSYHKIKSTLIEALGSDLFTHQNKVFSVKRNNISYDLTSFYVKKNGWTNIEIKKIQNFLSQDNQSEWITLFSPFDRENELSDFNNALAFQSVPITDDRPFDRLVINPFQITQYKLLVILFFCILIISIVMTLYFYKYHNVSFSVINSSFFSGATFHLAQTCLILLFQKVLGSPAVGMTTGIVATLFCPLLALILSTIFQRTGFILYTSLIINIVSLFFFFLLDSKNEIVQIIFIISSCLLQSVLYIRFLEKNSPIYLTVFLFNGMGALIGLWLFYILYSSLGFNFNLPILNGMYLIASLALFKNLKKSDLHAA